MSPSPETFYERFIERTQLPISKELSKGFVDFDRHLKRKPFVEEPKPNSNKTKFPTKNKRFLSLSPDRLIALDHTFHKSVHTKKLYDKDREIWDPCTYCFFKNKTKYEYKII